MVGLDWRARSDFQTNVPLEGFRERKYKQTQVTLRAIHPSPFIVPLANALEGRGRVHLDLHPLQLFSFDYSFQLSFKALSI